MTEKLSDLPMIATRVRPEIELAVRQAAAQSRMSISAWLREYLEREFEHNVPPADRKPEETTHVR